MKLKKDCTPEEWAVLRERGRGYDAQYRQLPERVVYMKDYLSRYSKTEAYREKDNARYNGKRRDDQLARTRLRDYGVTREQTADIMLVQNDACAVCRRPFDRNVRSTKDCLDHCHDTGQVRGLLCLACNLAEGYIKQTGLSSEEFARRLQSYLDNPPAEIAKLV